MTVDRNIIIKLYKEGGSAMCDLLSVMYLWVDKGCSWYQGRLYRINKIMFDLYIIHRCIRILFPLLRIYQQIKMILIS